MKDFKIHLGSYIKFVDFSSYHVFGLAKCADIENLIDFDRNNVAINHVMIKFFYANLNLEYCLFPMILEALERIERVQEVHAILLENHLSLGLVRNIIVFHYQRVKLNIYISSSRLYSSNIHATNTSRF